MFQRYKYIFIAGAIILIIGVIIMVLLVIQSRNKTVPAQPLTVLQEANFPGSAIKTPNQTGNKITWQTEQGPVEIANIFNGVVKKNQYGDPDSIDLAEADNYSIKYLFNGDYILVNLLSATNPNEARTEAEQKLISILQGEKSRLCWLSIPVMLNFNPDLQSFDYGLSFCPGSIKSIK